MKSMKGPIKRLTELLNPEATRVSEGQRKEFEYMLNRANARQRVVDKHRRMARRRQRLARRVNRA